ncbi:MULTISPECIES: PD-(D/E)XK motif protein [unclassified Bradyrhizobium]|uniref:PD-(D/E)XK motif protein n=1 Tax=unclassified Bradyrhizobium TaxID=2631580 RepID=UPI0029161A7C|nr:MULTISPECIES: PD-(D/E)XK motif protein [unclassified Bradyrhizobium]
MAAPSDPADLRAAWRALAGELGGGGWRTIPISVRAPCTLFAGRRLPSGEEAVLVGFRHLPPVSDARLPQGRGFEVLRLELDPNGNKQPLLALARKSGGSLELFGMMADDLADLLDACASEAEEEVLRRFLSRIHAWQDFMDRRMDGVLSEEAEQGLFGELLLLRDLIEYGVPSTTVLDAWRGPIDGVQDFMLGTGAIEVKTTLSVGGFPATISSLEQLDERLRQPLFIAGIRLALASSGTTLPAMADLLRAKLRDASAAIEMFDCRLIQAGLIPAAATRYTRQFVRASSAIFAVQGDFPRLTRANVALAVRKAHYEIDIDMTGAADVGLKHALELLGV